MRTAQMAAEALVRTDEPQSTTTPLLATIRAACGGDAGAFEELMVATEHRVALLAWRILGDREEVKEAVQETFLRVFRHFSRYDEQHDFFGWLYRIGVNVCRDLDRRRRRRNFFAPLRDAWGAKSEPRHDEKLAHESEVAILMRAIDTLPFIGLVDAYERSVSRLERLIKPFFPNFTGIVVRKNVTKGESTAIDEALDKIRGEIGDALYAELLDRNRDDLELFGELSQRYEEPAP